MPTMAEYLTKLIAERLRVASLVAHDDNHVARLARALA